MLEVVPGLANDNEWARLEGAITEQLAKKALTKNPRPTPYNQNEYQGPFIDTDGQPIDQATISLEIEEEKILPTLTIATSSLEPTAPTNNQTLYHFLLRDYQKSQESLTPEEAARILAQSRLIGVASMAVNEVTGELETDEFWRNTLTIDTSRDTIES